MLLAWSACLAPALAQSGSLLGVQTEGSPQGPQATPVVPQGLPPVPQVPQLPPVPQKPGNPNQQVGFGIVQVRTTLNVRTGPWGPIIGSLGPNSVVKIIGREGPWYVIEYNGQRGYVHSEYIFTPNNNPFGNGAQPPGQIQSPTGSTVRQTPFGNVIGNLPPGTPVTILGRTNNWWMVQAANGTVGYVPVSALDPNAAAPVVPRARYGVPGYTGPAVTPFNVPQALNVPGSGAGRGARATNGVDRHPNQPTVQLEVFPVPNATRYSDDFGIGTHSPGASPYNMGIDIFAPAGSPILAPVGGRITQMRSNGLGGITMHIVGPDGTDYYFAHLSGYAPGLRPGMTIPAGTHIGYVGNTGNARGTAPHLHFSAVKAGSAIAPYRGLCQCP